MSIKVLAKGKHYELPGYLPLRLGSILGTVSTAELTQILLDRFDHLDHTDRSEETNTCLAMIAADYTFKPKENLLSAVSPAYPVLDESSLAPIVVDEEPARKKSFFGR